jgi:hypothetical protein
MTRPLPFMFFPLIATNHPNIPEYRFYTLRYTDYVWATESTFWDTATKSELQSLQSEIQGLHSEIHSAVWEGLTVWDTDSTVWATDRVFNKPNKYVSEIINKLN